jgi:hypothetical protein
MLILDIVIMALQNFYCLSNTITPNGQEIYLCLKYYVEHKVLEHMQSMLFIKSSILYAINTFSKHQIAYKKLKLGF